MNTIKCYYIFHVKYKRQIPTLTKWYVALTASHKLFKINITRRLFAGQASLMLFPFVSLPVLLTRCWSLYIAKFSQLFIKFSTGGSDRSFNPIFNKSFDQLETSGHYADLSCPVPHLNAPKRTSYYPKRIMFQFQLCCQRHINIS